MATVSNLRETHEYNPNSLCLECNKPLGPDKVIYHEAYQDKHYFHKKCFEPLIIKNYFGYLHCPECRIKLDGTSLISYEDKKKLHLKNAVICMKFSILMFASISLMFGAFGGIVGFFDKTNTIPITELFMKGCSFGAIGGSICGGFIFVFLLGMSAIRETCGAASTNKISRYLGKMAENSSYVN